MGPHRERFLDDLPTLVTLLRRETRVHSDDLMPGTCSLCTENIKERAPTGIENAFREMVIFYHAADVQILHCDGMIVLCIRFGGLAMMITALPTNPQVCFGNVLCCFPAAVATLLAAAELPLLAPKRPLGCAIETRIVHRVALTVRQEALESHI